MVEFEEKKNILKDLMWGGDYLMDGHCVFSYYTFYSLFVYGNNG